MVERIVFYDRHPALRYGAYSGVTLLLGEDPEQFRKLHDDLMAEFNPEGRSECAIIQKFAHLMWREQHLAIYACAAQAQKRYSEIRSELGRQHEASRTDIKVFRTNSEEVDEVKKAAEKEASKELGSAWTLIEMGDVLTLDHLSKELEIAERLSRLKERLLKQLMFVRGVKSLSSEPAPASPRRITNAA